MPQLKQLSREHMEILSEATNKTGRQTDGPTFFLLVRLLVFRSPGP